MTEAELFIEHAYRVEERLGMLCGTATPTDEELKIAVEEADAAIAVLRRESVPLPVLARDQALDGGSNAG